MVEIKQSFILAALLSSKHGKIFGYWPRFDRKMAYLYNFFEGRTGKGSLHGFVLKTRRKRKTITRCQLTRSINTPAFCMVYSYFNFLSLLNPEHLLRMIDLNVLTKSLFLDCYCALQVFFRVAQWHA